MTFCCCVIIGCKGRLVTQRHNEVGDALGDLAALAYNHVICEPIVCEGSDTVPALIADLGSSF